jgi:16S rRNA (guanine527-N7)-methyltransferase
LRVGELDPRARERLEAVLSLLASDRAAPTSVPAERGWDVHVADSLAGLEVDELRSASAVADVGAGGGFPGLALAAVLDSARVDLIESVGRRCEFIRRAIDAGGFENAGVVCRRAEEWGRNPPPKGGAGAYDAITARAVGRLATLAELAAPLLREGGVLVAWKGRRDPDEEGELERAAEALGMARERVSWVGPYAGSRNRHLHVVRKVAPTPPGLPRRAGMAKKRPFGSLGRR